MMYAICSSGRILPRHTTVGGLLVAFRLLLWGVCQPARCRRCRNGRDPLEDQLGSVFELVELLPDVLGEPSSLSAHETLKQRTAIGQEHCVW